LEAHKDPLQLEAHKDPLQLEAHKDPLQLEAHKDPLQLEAHKDPLQLEAHKDETLDIVNNIIPVLTNISDMEEVMMREARKRAEERITNEHAEDKEKKGFGKITGLFNRGKRFFNRKNILDQYIQEELEKLRAEMFTGKFAQASDRRETEFYGNFDASTKRSENLTHSIETTELNELAQQYVNGEIDDNQFQNLFQTYIQNNEELNNALQDIQNQGTNVLLKLKKEKEYRDFIKSISNGQINDTDIKKYKIFLERDFGVSFTKQNIELLKLSLGNNEIIEKILSKQINLKIDVLVGGDGAFDTKNQVRQNNSIEKNTVNRIGKWLDRHPIFTLGSTPIAVVGTALAFSNPLITMLVGAGMAGAIVGAKRASNYSDSHNQYEERVVRGEDEYARILRKIQEDEENLKNNKLGFIKKILLNRRIKNNRKKLKLYQRRGVDGNPQIETRKGTTHRHFAPINVLNEKLENYLNKEDGEETKHGLVYNPENHSENYQKLTSERQFFEMWLGQALARLDNWRATGYNFLKMKENIGKTNEQMDEEMEVEMNRLHKNILAGANKLGIKLEDIQSNNESYKKTMERLNADLMLAQDNFKTTRRNEALKKGATSSAVYLGTSLIFQGIFHNGIFAKTEIIPGSESISISDAKLRSLIPQNITTETSYTDWIQRPENIEMLKNNGYLVQGENIFSIKEALDPNIASRLEIILGQEKANKFITSLAQDTRPNTLWETLKDTIFNNTHAGNDAKNQVMQFILEASAEGKNDLLSPELFNEAVSKGILSDVVNHTPRIDKIVSLMHNWGYTDVNYDFIANAVGELQNNGNNALSAWSTEKKVKVSEALWCYVHRDGIASGSPMYEVFIDKVANQSLVDFTQVAEQIKKAPAGLFSGLGIPTFRNTFLSPLGNEKIKDENGVGDDDKKEEGANPVPNKGEKKKIPIQERLKGYRGRFISSFNEGLKLAKDDGKRNGNIQFNFIPNKNLTDYNSIAQAIDELTKEYNSKKLKLRKEWKTQNSKNMEIIEGEMNLLLIEYLRLFKSIPLDISSEDNLKKSYDFKKDNLRKEWKTQNSKNMEIIEGEMDLLLKEYLKLIREKGFKAEKKETGEVFLDFIKALEYEISKNGGDLDLFKSGATEIMTIYINNIEALILEENLTAKQIKTRETELYKNSESLLIRLAERAKNRKQVGEEGAKDTPPSNDQIDEDTKKYIQKIRRQRQRT
ncbi:DUF2345 domain-containing protein, partial [Candidatus Gracilibacteria bacterium]|nr:DUF2345 domain-containing protein [Candidatus Gracilibacteria bacterium]